MLIMALLAALSATAAVVSFGYFQFYLTKKYIVLYSLIFGTLFSFLFMRHPDYFSLPFIILGGVVTTFLAFLLVHLRDKYSREPRSHE